MSDILAVRTWSHGFYRGEPRITREALLVDGSVVPFTGEIPAGVPHTRGCREASGRTYGGGEFADLLGWGWWVPVKEVAAELMRRREAGLVS